MTVRLTNAEPSDLASIAALAASGQHRPDRHIAYFGDDAEAIASEIAEVADWPDATTVAREGSELVGWLLAETEEELHRVWWWGPVAPAGERWAPVADSLYEVTRARLDPAFVEEELAADDRHVELARFAERHGFLAEEASVLLRITLDGIDDVTSDDGCVPLSDLDHDDVARLHDRLFPGTHTTGRQLVAQDDHVRLVAHDAARAVGYVSVEVQAGGNGYIDFLGVDEQHRGRGLGRALVAGALAALAGRGIATADLTVRESNAAARGLYGSLGFTEVRLLRPYRRGFGLDTSASGQA